MHMMLLYQFLGLHSYAIKTKKRKYSMRTYETVQKEYKKDVAKPALDTATPFQLSCCYHLPVTSHEGAPYHQGVSRASLHLSIRPSIRQSTNQSAHDTLGNYHQQQRIILWKLSTSILNSSFCERMETKRSNNLEKQA